MGKTGRVAGVGVGDQWVKPGDWELGDHMTEILLEFENAFSFSRRWSSGIV